MTTKEQKEMEARVLAYLQSIAMYAVALQQYVGSMDKEDEGALSWIDADLDVILSNYQEGDE